MWVARDYPPLEDVDSAIFSVRGTGAPSVTVATSWDDHSMLGYNPSTYVSTPQAWPLDLYTLHHFAATFADSGEANMYYGKTPFDVALQWEVLNVSIDAAVLSLNRWSAAGLTYSQPCSCCSGWHTVYWVEKSRPIVRFAAG